MPMPGPLSGLKVVELQGRGPAPFATMVLADLGADVVTIGRTGEVATPNQARPKPVSAGQRRLDLLTRNKRAVAIDLKRPEGRATALHLIDQADVLTESNRPGVAERLGLGPDVCLERNPRLIYARMTGWGREGDYAQAPGHDINYLALAGALSQFRRPGQPPMPPLNLLGDFGGGGMLLVAGVLAALFERSRSGRGQVVDAAMVDGVALLMTLFFGLRAEGLWNDEPGSNVLDLGAPHYNVYETADGRFVSIGAGEPQFYQELLQRLGLDPKLAHKRSDRESWGEVRAQLAAVFRSKTLAQWREQLEGTQCCFAPVLTMDEAATHPHNVARGTFVQVQGVVQPAPAPRFTRTPAGMPKGSVLAGQHTVEVLTEWGLGADDVATLLAAKTVVQAPSPGD